MGKLADFLTGTRVLEEVESPINGKISVVKSLAWGTYIQVDGLTQSGGILEGIWKKTLRILNSQFSIINSCLIIGLGGGTAAKLVRKYWPKTRIVGVDLDSVMVELGKKYLGLDKVHVQVHVQDAYEFVRVNSKNKRKFDLILVDLYVGREYPERFESEIFIKAVSTILSKNGSAIFNRLYFGEKRKEAMKFGEKLEKVFPRAERFFPEANLMFICAH